MTTLKTGTLRYTAADGSDKYVFVSGGFAEALPDKVTILAESAERRDDIDLERARAALERAQKRLADERVKDDMDYTRLRAALERALQRIRLAESRK